MSQNNQSTGLYTFARTEDVITGYDDVHQSWVRTLMKIEVTIDLDRVYSDVAFTVGHSKRGKTTKARGAIVGKRIKPPKGARA